MTKEKTTALGIPLGLLLGLLAALTWAADAAAQGRGGAFTAHLSGDAEVSPVETDALGQAVVRVTPRGISHSLVVARIQNVVAAHIHCAPEGVDGPVGVTLFAGGPTTVSGILAQGPILDVDSGNACGWEDLDDLLDALGSGDTYVNVHTTTNPGGEIRGQLR